MLQYLSNKKVYISKSSQLKKKKKKNTYIAKLYLKIRRLM